MVMLAAMALLAFPSPALGFIHTRCLCSPSRQAPARVRRTTLAGRNTASQSIQPLYPPRSVQKALGVAGTRAHDPRFFAVTPLRVSGMNGDDIDPLEAGPDPQVEDFNVRSKAADDAEEDDEDDEEEEEDSEEATEETVEEEGEESMPAKRGRGRPSRRSVPEDRSDAASMGGLASMVSAQRNVGSKRKRRDPLMPKGAPDPVEWSKVGNMQEGGRAHLVIYHTGFEEDKARAAKLTKMVADRYGHLVNICEFSLEEEDMTDDERRDSNLFEVFLAGLDQVHYHSRAECWSDMTEEHMVSVTEDIGSRVSDEAIIHVDASYLPEYLMPGISFQELMLKYPPL